MATSQPRPSALNRDLVPTISIDTGSAATAIVARSGPVPLAAVVVLNPETTSDRSTPGADPAIGYAKAVEDAVAAIAAEHADVARAWYGLGVVPADRDPWLYTVEKINPARAPRTATEAQHFDPIHVAEGSTFAANAVTNRLLGVLHGKIAWVIPFHADTRWEARWEHGTGNPFDFYPAAFLAPVLPEGNTGAVYRDRYLDDRAFGQTRVKDVCAAWSIGTDAAEDYERACISIYGRTLPPHLADKAVARTSPGALNRNCGAPTVRRFDVASTVEPAEQRFECARNRLMTLLSGTTVSPHELARDLLTVAEYKGLSVEDAVTKWESWVSTTPSLNDSQVRLIQQVRRVTLAA